MKVIDISMSIHQAMPVYKNKPEKKPVLKFVQDFTISNSCESELIIGMHTGTHVDAPLHMLPGGNTVDRISLAKVVTECRVLDFTGLQDKITANNLATREIQPGAFILLKTKNSYKQNFDFNFVFLEQSGAIYLKEAGVSGVGIDALGIERDQPGHPTHKTLFEAGIIIIEGLRLAGVEEGNYFLCAAPLKVVGAESAPARAFLIRF
ncbi:cyclase family protein [Desulfotruncus alcoholivorax]|uniref:cyclase family protein n=1 Tax=Desulfotruncus alcoholivorax TaxID=265477 RepID=UPI0004182569|nr:cyclase family protein [Desulfotruncus alcoholivorax]